jgi:hypothetical protein
MSKLNDLRSKGETVKLSNEMELLIKPMRLGLEAEIGELYDQKKIGKAMILLVKDAIKMALPDVTDEELNDLNKVDLKLITKKVFEVNGLNLDEKKKLTTT